MKTTDENIRELFSEKMKGAEAPVDPAIWSTVQSSIGTGAATSGAGAAAGGSAIGSVAGWVAAAIAVVSIATAVFFFSTNEDSVEVSKDTPIEQQEDVQTDEVLEVSELVPNELTSEQEQPDESSADQTGTEPQNTTLADAQSTPAAISSDGIGGPADTVVSYEIARGAPEQITEPEENPSTTVNSTEQNETTEVSALFNAIKDWSDELTYEFVAQYDGDAEFSWDVDGELYEGKSIEVEFEEGEHTVQLKVTAADNSYEIHESQLEVYKTPEVKKVNTFSPFASPGLSDTFDLQAVSTNVTITRVIVFNRNQQVVYDSNNRQDPWDGYDRYGNKCEVATYTYQYEGVNVYGEAVAGGGHVTISDN